MTELHLVHLFPELMGTYGDRGNVLCLEQRARWRGIDVTVHAVEVGDALPPEADLVFIGGGQDRCQQLVAPRLLDMGPLIARAATDGAVVFGVCGGYQLLGSSYRTATAEVPGLGLLDLSTVAGERRLLGNVAITCELGGARFTVVGFENHSGRTYLGPGARPLGRVMAGNGNNGQDGTEGAIQGRVLGTYLHGPVLPRNPRLADALLAMALERRGVRALVSLDDGLEEAAHEHGLVLARGRRRLRRAFARR